MIKLYNGNGGEVEITPSDDSYRLKELMGADEVVLRFALPDYLAISTGAYITYKGDRYEVESEDSVRMIHTEMYEYTITLSAPRAHLRRYIVREKGGEGRITFFLTAKPREHLDLIVHNLNEREAGWAVGACLDGSEKTIEYSTTNALDALSKLAEAYGTEWECQGRTLSLRKAEYHKDSPLIVSYGKGKGLLSGLERNPAEEQPVGTLYVTGTDRNIDPAKYKSKTLHLPEGATRAVGGRTYTVTSGGRAITVSGSAPDAVEGAFTDTDIYPSREGVVKTVTIRDKEKAFVDFTDPTIPADLDFEKCLIPGREMKIAFQTGMLAGRTFGAKYVHKDRRFEIVPEEIDGVLMPSAPFLPKEGDRYGVFEIALPESYILRAEERLLDSAVQYLEGLETSRYSYRAAVDPLWLKKQWTKVGHKVRIGAYVRLAGDPITDGGATLRITGIKEYLTDPYAPEVTLSDRATGRGGLTSIIRKAVQDDLTSTREASTRTAVELARRTFHKAEQLTDALEKALGAHFEAMVRPLAVHTMQVLVGDKSLQFAYVENPASTKEVPLPLTFDTVTKSLHIDQAYLQHKTLGVEVTTAHTAKDFRTWTIAPIDYSPKGTAPLYLYARVPREGDGGTFVIDTRAHDFEEETGYYHLWSGMLTPTDDGTRWEYLPMHGFTEITPGMISSPRFTSPDGRLVIDMVKGYFRFKTDKSTFSVNADNPDGVYIRGGMISVGGQNLTMEEAFEEQERKIENAKKVRQPIIKNGTWWVWDDTTNQLIDSGKPAQGATGATGEKGEQGAPGKDGAPVRDNLFTAKLYTFAQNDRYGAKCTHLGDGRWRVEKVAKSDRTYFDGASFFVDPIRDTKSGRYTISFRVVETRRPIKYQNTTAVSKKGSTITGDRYISTDNSNNGRLPGFSFYWGETPTNGNEIGDYTIIDQVKIERVAEGEDPMPTAYLPHPLDLKGEPGKDVDPKVLNDLKTAVDDARRKLDDTVTKAELDGVVSAQEEHDIQAAKAALDAAKKAYDDAVAKAKELDGEIQVGGRNLLRPAGYGYGKEDTNNYRTVVQDGNGVLHWTQKDRSTSPYQLFTHDRVGKGSYTLSFKANVGEGFRDYLYFTRGDATGDTWLPAAAANATVQIREGVWLHTATYNDLPANGSTWINYYGVDPSSPVREVTLWDFKLERGTVATDWTPAPEDVQAEIERERSERETAVREVATGLSSAKSSISALEQAKEEIEKGKLSISDLPKNLKWIYDAFHHGETQIEGGLILSKYIGLSNSSDKVTSYISGEDGAGAHMLAAGVTSLADQDAVSYINYDGSAKFGELEIDKNGWVMISNVGRNKRLDVTHITSDAVCFEDHTGGRWRSTKAHIGMSADGDAMEIIVDGGTAITLSKKGVHVNSFDDRLMPRVLAHGKFDKSGRLSKAIAYNDPNTSGVDSRFSCSRVSEGKYRLTFPGEWLNPWSTLVFQGTEQDSQSGQSARFVSFGPATRYGGSAYVYVFGADDRNLRDVSVYFQIIAL